MAADKEDKQVRISAEVHEEVTALADAHRMNIGGLVDNVIRFWLVGETYALPLSEPSGKAIKRATAPTPAPQPQKGN
jgi:hypothetical protein